MGNILVLFFKKIRYIHSNCCGSAPTPSPKNLIIKWSFAFWFALLIISNLTVSACPLESTSQENPSNASKTHEGKLLSMDTVNNELFKELSANFDDQSIAHLAKRARLVAVNLTALKALYSPQVSSNMTLHLFDDLILTVRHKKTQRKSSGNTLWVGDAIGKYDGQVLLVISDQAISGTISLPGVGNYSIQSRSSGEHIIFQRKDLNESITKTDTAKP